LIWRKPLEWHLVKVKRVIVMKFILKPLFSTWTNLSKRSLSWHT
jgi:hypothetical protein